MVPRARRSGRRGRGRPRWGGCSWRTAAVGEVARGGGSARKARVAGEAARATAAGERRQRVKRSGGEGRRRLDVWWSSGSGRRGPGAREARRHGLSEAQERRTELPPASELSSSACKSTRLLSWTPSHITIRSGVASGSSRMSIVYSAAAQKSSGSGKSGGCVSGSVPHCGQSYRAAILSPATM
jgi:hypothetical protein